MNIDNINIKLGDDLKKNLNNKSKLKLCDYSWLSI